MKQISIIVFAVLTALPLSGADKRVPDPEVPQLGVFLNGNGELTLDSAIAIARANDPSIVLARLDSERQGAVAREASGLFDDSVEAGLTAEYLRGELLPPVQSQQFSQRDIFNKFAVIFQRVSDDLIRNLDADPNFDTIPCSDALPEGSEIVIIDENGNEVIIRCTPDDEPTAIGDIFDIIIGSGNNPGLDAAIQAYKDFGQVNSRDEIRKIADLLAQNAATFREQLRLFGIAPFMEERLSLTLAGGYRFTMRNGINWAPAVGIETIEENFVAKSQDPRQGGKGPASFRTAAGLEINVPFGRGRGLGVADALERSATLNYTASLSGTRHAETITVFRTAVAFWNLLAAQRRIAEADEAAKRSERMLEIGQEMVDGGEVAEVELNQLKALAGDSRRTWLQSRLALRQAQLDLATTIGLRIESAEDFPVAVGELPDVVEPETLRAVPVDALVGEALERRHDIDEAFGRIDAASALTYAARKSLAPKVDLNFFLFYESRSQAYSYMDGLKDAAFGNWLGPSAGLTLTVELPVKNLAQIGQYRRAHSLQRQSQIRARDLQRSTRGRVVEVWGALIEAAEVVSRLESSERMYRQALQDEGDRFEKGEGTVLGPIFIQEQLASAQLQLVDARLNWANLLAQLRYETGTIVDPEFGDTMADILGTPPIADTGIAVDPVTALANDLKNANTNVLPVAAANR